MTRAANPKTVVSAVFVAAMFVTIMDSGLGFSAIHSRLYRRTGPRRLMRAGGTGAAAVIRLMALAGGDRGRAR